LDPEVHQRFRRYRLGLRDGTHFAEEIAVERDQELAMFLALLLAFGITLFLSRAHLAGGNDNAGYPHSHLPSSSTVSG
jgi:hypothetical protein